MDAQQPLFYVRAWHYYELCARDYPSLVEAITDAVGSYLWSDAEYIEDIRQGAEDGPIVIGNDLLADIAAQYRRLVKEEALARC